MAIVETLLPLSDERVRSSRTTAHVTFWRRRSVRTYPWSLNTSLATSCGAWSASRLVIAAARASNKVNLVLVESYGKLYLAMRCGMRKATIAANRNPAHSAFPATPTGMCYPAAPARQPSNLNVVDGNMRA